MMTLKMFLLKVTVLLVIICPGVTPMPLEEAEPNEKLNRQTRQLDFDFSFLEDIDNWVSRIRRFDRQNCLQRMLCERMAYRNIPTNEEVENVELELEPDPDDSESVLIISDETSKEPRSDQRAFFTSPFKILSSLLTRTKRQFSFPRIDLKSMLTLADTLLGSTSFSSYGLTHAAYMGTTFEDPTNCYRIYGTCPDNVVRVLHRMTGGSAIVNRENKSHRSHF